MNIEATSEVLEVGEISFVGNIIPHAWYQHIRYPNGLPHLPAIIILSDIAYWYRPQYVRDEHTGHIIAVRKKFAGDKLRRNYKSFAQYGLTEKQAREALYFLRDEIQAITTEVRVADVNGVAKKQLFIGLIPSRL